MASSTSSSLLAPPHFTCQVAGRPTPAATAVPLALSVPAVVRIRSWRRFAAARDDVALVPSRRLRALPRRRNALREKALPLLVEHQVRHPNHEALESRHQSNKNCDLVGGTGEFWSRSSLDRQEPRSRCLDDKALSVLDEKLEISGCLDAVRSGNVLCESNLDGEKDEDGVAEGGHFCSTGTGAGTGPVFSIYEDPDGNVVHVEVDEDEIISRSAGVEGEESDDLQPMLSRARVMAKGFESDERKVPKNSSLFQFVAVQKNKSCVVDAEVLVVQRNEPPLRGVVWSGFAALCGVCIVLATSRLISRNVKMQLSKKVFDILRHVMTAGELDKGNIMVISDVHKFPGDLLGRPHLERSELMNNIKRARESRERFSVRKLFSCYDVANAYNANITEIRRMVPDVHTLVEGLRKQSNTEKKNCVAFLHPVAAPEDEVSACYGTESIYLVDVSDNYELPETSLSNDIMEESEDQSLDLKNGAPVVDNSIKNQNNVGEIELPKPTYSDERMTDPKDKASVIYAAEKEANVYSADDHNVDPDIINTLPSEFERKEQFTEIGVNNLDGTKGMEPSVPFSRKKQMLYTEDNAHQISTNVVPETTDDFSSYSFKITTSGLENNEASLDTSANDLNYMQETEAPSAFANDAQAAHCKEFAHGGRTIGNQACNNPVKVDILGTKSLQKIREEHVGLLRDYMQTMQEPGASNQDDKQVHHANETETNSETDNAGTLDKASASSLHALQEEKVQHKGAKISISEKQEKITSCNKKARAYLKKDKGKLQKEMCSGKVPKTELSAEGVPGTVVGPSNGAQKTKRVDHKRLKKVRKNQGVTERVAAQGVVQNSSRVDQKNSSQNAKRTRRKNQRSACHTQQGAQTREEHPQTALMANSPDDAPRAENMKPLGGAGSSTGTLSPKDTFREAQPNGFIVSTARKEELKLNLQTSEWVEAAIVETKTNMHGDNVMHEVSTDLNNSKVNMAAKKPTRRQSLLQHSEPSNSVSNKDSEPTDG